MKMGTSPSLLPQEQREEQAARTEQKQHLFVRTNIAEEEGRGAVAALTLVGASWLCLWNRWLLWSRLRAKFSTEAEKEDKFKKWGFCGRGKPGYNMLITCFPGKKPKHACSGQAL